MMFKRIQFIFFFILIFFIQIIHVQSEELDIDQLLQKLDSIESRIKVLEKATFRKTSSGIGNTDVLTLGGSNISLNSGTIVDTADGSTAASLVLSGLSAVAITVSS